MNIVQKNFSKNLKQIREQHHLSQTDLAKAINISASSISSYEIGRATPSLEIASKLAYFLGCSLDALVQIPKIEGSNEGLSAKKEISLQYIQYIQSVLDTLDSENPMPGEMSLFDQICETQKKDWNDFLNDTTN